LLGCGTKAVYQDFQVGVAVQFLERFLRFDEARSSSAQRHLGILVVGHTATDPAKRGPGFGISFLAIAGMWAGGLWAAAKLLIAQ